MNTAASTYAILRRQGELVIENNSTIPAMRRMARKDGLKIVSSTERDYMGRPRYFVALVSPSNPTLIVCPDAD